MTTVLLVEDEPDIREAQTELLLMAGFTPIPVATVAEAALALQENHIDVMFSDIRLGEDSGLDLAYRVHRDYPNVAVVLTTGYSGGNSEIHWPLIRKPFSFDSAVQLINQTLRSVGA